MVTKFIFCAFLSAACAQNLLYETSLHTPKPCCVPDKEFEVTMSYLGATLKAGNADAIVETHRMSVDTTGQRVSIQVYINNIPEVSLHYIYAYDKKVYYLIVPNTECLMYKLNTTLASTCVPDTATFLSSDQLDPDSHRLEVNNWMDMSQGYPSQYTTSAKQCIPISEAYYYSLPTGESKILTINYSNYASGIADPSVIVPPSSGCIPSDTPPLGMNYHNGRILYNGLR